jgi:hypothetical protein
LCVDLIISSESGFDGDDEADSTDDNEQTGLFSNFSIFIERKLSI